MQEEYYAIPVCEDAEDVLHTDEDLFCGDMSCPCHEDNESISVVGEQVQDGMLTPDEADQYYHGKTL